MTVIPQSGHFKWSTDASSFRLHVLVGQRQQSLTLSSLVSITCWTCADARVGRRRANPEPSRQRRISRVQ